MRLFWGNYKMRVLCQSHMTYFESRCQIMIDGQAESCFVFFNARLFKKIKI